MQRVEAPSVAVHGLLVAVAALVVEHRLKGARASGVVALGLSFPAACRVFPGQ